MKISVVVPVYNAERYLKKCIHSVIRQEYSDWELLLIDDGSTDGSGGIMEVAAKKDNRIIAVHQQNVGPGSARNKGIEMATGDFVVFLDADDFLDKEYFKLLSFKMKKHDVIYIDVAQISLSGKVLEREYMSKYKNWSRDRILRAQMTGKIPWGGVRKAVRLSLLRENKIVFTAHSVGEEALYSFRVLFAANSVGFIDEKPVYFYVIHDNSQSGQKIVDPLGDVADSMKTYLLQQKLYTEYADTMNAFNLTATVIALDRIEQMYRGAEKKKAVMERMRRFQESYDDFVGMDYRSLCYKAKIFVPFLRLGISWPVLGASRLIRRKV
ncbi:MAG: glycosyltransferase family 2 protein [Dorea sp.]|jgi:glycosyltransferase involved in cell wall biosynthesis|nr:glycosyltransferase family 2 protein [Dorea sp.]